MTPEAAHLSSDFRAAFSSVSRCTARTGSTSSFTATCAGMHACCVDLQSFMHQNTHASAHCEACRGVPALLKLGQRTPSVTRASFLIVATR